LIDFDKPDHSLIKRFDWLGLAAMAAFLGSLEYVLEEGTRLEWFQSHEILFFTVVMVAGAVLFFWRALTRHDPLVDLYAFRNRNFAFGSLFSFCMGIGLYGLTYLYPVYLGRIRGYDALMIGETMFVTGLCMFLTAPVAGRLSAKLDPRVMMMIGFSGFALGTWIASHITTDWDFYELLWPQILRGCSLMLCMVPINNIALGSLPPQQLKNASGLYNLTRNLGGAVGLAIINTMLNTRTDLHITRLHEMVVAGRGVAEEAIANTAQRFIDYGDAAQTMALALVNQRVHKQALVMAFGDVFIGLTVIFGSLVVLSLFLSKPPKPVAGGGGGGH
jgi:DHA2 family multidrug resistance protein